MGNETIRKRLGLVFNNDDQWIGGTYYTINLIHALNLLADNEKPQLVVFSNSADFQKLKNETNYPYLVYELFDQKQFSKAIQLINKVALKVIQKPLFKNRYKGFLDALFIMQKSDYLEDVPIENRIYWIPDFQDKHYPEFFTPEGLDKKHERSQWIADNARNIVLSSESVKKDWEYFYPQYKGTTTVVNFAVTHPEFESLDVEMLRVKFNLPVDYFFSPNQFWAHKNHIVVIKAAQILKQKGKPIVIAFSGKENDNRNPNYTEELKKYVADNQLEDVVRFLGFLDRREQLKLMKNAKAVIQPSLFEGWSTVIEDAMAMNQVVIASDLEVNIEQLGGSGLFFESRNEADLAQKMQFVLREPQELDFSYEKRLISFGKKLIRTFHID